jgi:hypothetical protein
MDASSARGCDGCETSTRKAWKGFRVSLTLDSRAAHRLGRRELYSNNQQAIIVYVRRWWSIVASVERFKQI